MDGELTIESGFTPPTRINLNKLNKGDLERASELSPEQEIHRMDSGVHTTPEKELRREDIESARDNSTPRACRRDMGASKSRHLRAASLVPSGRVNKRRIDNENMKSVSTCNTSARDHRLHGLFRSACGPT